MGSDTYSDPPYHCICKNELTVIQLPDIQECIKMAELYTSVEFRISTLHDGVKRLQPVFYLNREMRELILSLR